MDSKEIKINTYIYSEVKKFFRDNKIEYTIIYNCVSVNGSPKFNNILFEFDNDGYIRVRRIPWTGENVQIKPLNIYQFLEQLLRFKLIYMNQLKKYYIRGIHGLGRPSDLKVVKNEKQVKIVA